MQKDSEFRKKCVSPKRVFLKNGIIFPTVRTGNAMEDINATEEFDSDEMIDFVVRMNGRENCTDYIDNADSFL